MPRPTKPAAEEFKLEWPALLEEALTVEGSIGHTFNRFYRYSYLNQIFLRRQGAYEPVATYNKWKELGRQVLKGERAFAIVRPITVKTKELDEQGDEAEMIQRRFKIVRALFQVSQTEGDELPEVETPGWDEATALDKLSIHHVPFNDLDGNLQGYSYGREFAINPVAVHPTKTKFHELGHIVLGHTVPGNEEEYLEHRGLFEFQAESTAYLSMNEVGQLTPETASNSRGYIQGWLRGEERPDDSAIRQVFVATDQILRAGSLEGVGGA